MGNPNRLTIRKLIPAEDRAAFEAYLHVRFANYRIVGEWFRPPVEEMQWLESVSYCIGSAKELQIICGEDLRVDCCTEPHFFPVGEICPDDDLVRRNDSGNWFIMNPEEVVSGHGTETQTADKGKEKLWRSEKLKSSFSIAVISS